MVFCTYCGQSFTRDEHLERHILTHTNVKPFKCFNCHMSFARRDLLQRHYQVHGKDQNNQELAPAANGMIPKSAGRTPIACTNCAKTKTKCDKKFPCSRCEARNLHCTARPARRAPKNGSRNGISLDSSGTVVAGALEPGKETEQTAGPPHRPPLRPLGPAPPVARAPVPADEKSAVPTVDGPPSQHFEALTGGPQTAAIMRTPTTAPAPFVNNTPFSNYEEFQQMPGDSSESDSSPRFMIDWSHPMQMALGFDGSVQPQMLLTPDVGYDPAAMHSVPSGDNMLGITGPHFGHGMVAPLITPPMEMPKLERGFSHAGIHDHSPVQAQSRHLSYPNVGFGHLDDDDDDVQGEMQAIVAARDGWTCFRCTPTIASASCPKTARLNLERLEKTLKNHDGWSTWTPQWDEAEPTRNDNLTLMQLHESTRDKLLAITQTFLHKALEIHRGSAMPGYLRDSSIRRGSNFVLLPPAHVLAYFLRSYSNCFEHYYPLTSRGTLDANELMHCYNDRAASLLVLMMIAQGAMNIPCVEARMLTGGLTEACRISLFDLIEKDISMAGDPIVLHSALIFTVQAAWSGDKWQMDIAMGQRGMYLAMLRHSGVLDPSPQSVVMPSSHNSQVNHDQLWNEWIQLESRSRLVYSWVMVDQELALFHDTAPLFSVAEFNAPMPDADRLWRAQSAMAWSTEFEQVHEFSSGYSSVGSGVRPQSLRALFRYFLDDEIDSRKIQMTPLQLRLLLHPLQTMVCQCVQFLSCVSDASVTPAGQGPSTASTRNRLFEIQELLRRWFKLSELHSSPEPSAIMQTNLVIFHLISLNVVTDFPAIEQLARHHISLISNPFENCANAPSSTTAPGSSYSQNTFHQLRSRCIADLEEVVYHCGQILRLVREMPRGVRPPWWAGAIYRVALTLWTDAIAPSAPHLSQQTDQLAVATGVFQDLGFAIDNVAADDALLVQYLTKRQGVPHVTSRDGSLRGINDPTQIVLHCCELIEDGAATRFSDGIKAKLAKLAGV